MDAATAQALFEEGKRLMSTGAYADAEGRGHVILNAFFAEDTAKRLAQSAPSIDVITFTNVFAHIEDLPELL